LLTKSDYNGGGLLQKRTTYAYSYSGEADAVTRVYKALTVKKFYTVFPGDDTWSANAFYLFFKNKYKVVSGWSYPTSETTTYYDQNGQNPISSTRNFAHSSTHLQPTMIDETNSDGTKRITRMKYPADYATYTGSTTTTDQYAAYAIHMMKDVLNIQNVPVEKVVSELPPGGSESVVYAELSKFKMFTPTQLLKFERHTFVNNTKVSDFANSYVDGAGLHPDGRYRTIQRADSYDNYGNQMVVTDASGISDSLTYGYNAAKLISQTRGGLTKNYTYNSLFLLGSIIDENGASSAFEYDGFGRLIRLKGPNGEVLKEINYHYKQ
jgi:YD repeat-containing protein